MKIPVGTEEEEYEVHHYVEKRKVVKPVYVDIPFLPIALIAAFGLAILWQIIEPKQPLQPTNVNIHIEK